MAKSTPTIEILKRGKLVKAFPLGVPRLVIGSGAEANVRLRSDGIQAQHLAIEIVDRRFLQVVNLARDPRLRCDGETFQTRRLKNGSQVQLGEIVFRLKLQPTARPGREKRSDVGVDTAESLPVPPPRHGRRFSPPPPTEEDAPTPKELPAVRTVEPRGPTPPDAPPAAGFSLGDDTELTLEDAASPEAKADAERKEVGTQTVPMLDGEAAPWEKDVAAPPEAPPPTPRPAPAAPPRATPETPRPLPFLLIHPPGGRRKRVRLPVGTFDVGTSGCAITLNFAGIAERHVVLTTHADGAITVEDAGSGLPTVLNGRVVRRAQFRLEDTLQIGRVSFTLEPFPADAAGTAATPAAEGDEAPTPDRTEARPQADPQPVQPAAPPSTPAERAFQAQASAKWVEAALRKRESGDDEDDSLPGVPLSPPPAMGTPTDPIADVAAPAQAPPAPATPAQAPPAQATPAQATPAPAQAQPPREAPAPRPSPPAAAAAPRAPRPSGKKPTRPPARKQAAARPPRKPALDAEMPSEYKWQKRKRAALFILFILLLMAGGGAYGGWRIYEDRKTSDEAYERQTRNYSWGDQDPTGEGEYTWAGLVGAAGAEGEEADDGDRKRSSRRHRSRRGSGDDGSESAIASADGSWSGVDDKRQEVEEEEEDPEQRMLKDLMNESMDILDEEFEAKQKAWIDMEEVESVLRSVSSTALVCYKRALDDDPELGGTMSLRITIGTSGKVTSISLDPMSTMANSEMQTCVERQVRSKSYPAARGGPVTFTYPFRFSDR